MTFFSYSSSLPQIITGKHLAWVYLGGGGELAESSHILLFQPTGTA